jgi:hypothetical protein
MIGQYVRYKKGLDKKEYIVVDYFPEEFEDRFKKKIKFTAEIAIIQEFDFYPNRVKQLKIWQALDKFEILKGE